MLSTTTMPFTTVLASLAALLLLAPTTTGWIVRPADHHTTKSPATQHRHGRSTHLLAMVELEPEPEGGIALQPFSSMTACRVKQLDETVQTTNAENKEPAYKFWMTGQAEVRNEH